MALTRTTLSSAVAVDDTSIVVASATGFAAGRLVRVDQEWMVIQQNYASGTTIPVRRGQQGSANVAHVATAGVVVGTQADDWDVPGPGAVVNNMIAGRPRKIVSFTATPSTVVHAPAGCDQVVILNGTAAITLTIPIPTTDMDGDLLYIVSNGVAQHLLTFTGGLSGAGGSYDIVTINATAPAAFGFIACNALWMSVCGAAISGTTTAIAGAIA